MCFPGHNFPCVFLATRSACLESEFPTWTRGWRGLGQSLGEGGWRQL